MAYKFRHSTRPVYAYGALNGQNASPDGGQRQYNPLHTTAQSHRLHVRVEGDLNVTVAGTAVLNRGSILAAFTEMGLDENGTDQMKLDARALRQMAEYGVESGLSKTRAASAAVATTHLVEEFPLFFAHPRSLNPRETAFLVRDPKQSLRFFHSLAANANGVANIIQGGTATLSNVKVTIVQVMDEFETARPLFIPRLRQVSVPVVQAQGALELNIITGQYLRGLLIQQDSSLGEVADIINAMALYGDARQIFGPEMASFDTLARSQEVSFGGDVYGGGNGYMFVNFQPNGRLSDIWNPLQDNNLRFRFDCQPTAKAGAAASIIRVVLIELVRDPSARTPDGRPLVDPLEIPI